MKILLSHPLPVKRSRLAAALKVQSPDLDLLIAPDLTSTFDLAEHVVPDAVIIAEELCQREEFEILKALFDACRIHCVVIAESSIPPSFKGEPILTVSGDAEPADILAAVQRPPERRRFRQNDNTIGTNYSAPIVQNNGLILFGASTGGVDALLTVLSELPPSLPPVLLVQHTGNDFSGSLARLLNRSFAGTARIINERTLMESGHVYLAPDNSKHLCVDPQKTTHCTLVDATPCSGHRPSVDILFRSALCRARDVTAVLFTGMGRDGAEGLLELRTAGATTIGQDEATSVVYGMPRVASEIGALDKQLPLDRIAAAVLASCQMPPRSRRALRA